MPEPRRRHQHSLLRLRTPGRGRASDGGIGHDAHRASIRHSYHSDSHTRVYSVSGNCLPLYLVGPCSFTSISSTIPGIFPHPIRHHADQVQQPGADAKPHFPQVPGKSVFRGSCPRLDHPALLSASEFLSRRQVKIVYLYAFSRVPEWGSQFGTKVEF